MSHLKARYTNETGESPIVERACYYKTEYVQWLEKLVGESSPTTGSHMVPCPKWHLGGKCYGDPWKEVCPESPCYVTRHQ